MILKHVQGKSKQFRTCEIYGTARSYCTGEMEDDEYNKMWLKLSNNIKEVAHKGEPYFYAEICENIDNIHRNPLTQEQSCNAYKSWGELKVKEIVNI